MNAELQAWVIVMKHSPYPAIKNGPAPEIRASSHEI